MAEKEGQFPYRPPRQPLLAHVDIFGNGMHLGAMRLENLSAGGLGGGGFRFGHRDRVEVQLAGIGLVPARLVWKKDAQFGMAFDHDIPVEAFDLSGPNSGALPFVAGAPVAGYFRAEDRSYPPVSGEGEFVSPKRNRS